MSWTVRRPRILALLAGLVVVAVGLIVPSVGAQEPSDPEVVDDRLVVRAVDGRDPDAVTVEFLYSGPRSSVPDLVIRENGVIVQSSGAALLDETESFGIVLAIDVSASMSEGGAFTRAIDAARQFVENRADDDQIAIVAFGNDVQVVQRFTDDDDELNAALDGLGVGGFTALYDSVIESVNLFGSSSLVPNIIVLTDGKDTNSASDLGGAISRLDAENALLFAVGIETAELDTGALQRLVDATGGAVLTVDDPARLAEVYDEVQSTIKRQYEVSFVSEVDRTGSVPLALTIGTTSVSASYAPGARLDTTIGVRPVETTGTSGVSALQSRTFVWVAVGLALFATAVAAFAVGLTVTRDRGGLNRVLQPYADGFVASDPDDEDRMATTSFISRAVEITGDFAERRGVLGRVEDRLEQANLPLRPAEAIFFSLAGGTLAAVLGYLLGGAFGFLVMAAAAVVGPPVALSFLASRRKKQFDAQLPDMLTLLASTLRAGFSLMQGVEAAANEVAEPMRRELLRVVNESRLGMPLEEALSNVADRMESRDFEWAVMAIGIQREVGGNLSELLDTVASTMTQRERLRRDINSLTAEGKISAIVLGILPIGLGLVIFTLNRDYMNGLIEETIGLFMLGGAAVLMGIGFAWMYKLIDIEV